MIADELIRLPMEELPITQLRATLLFLEVGLCVLLVATAARAADPGVHPEFVPVGEVPNVTGPIMDTFL